MKKNLILNLAILFSVPLFQTFAFAYKEVPLISIRAELFPGETYTIGFNADSNNVIQGAYYADPHQADPVNRKKEFSVGALKNPQTIVKVKKFKTFDVVKLSYWKNIMTIHYRSDVREDEWTKKDFKVECDANLNCNVTDLSTGRVIRHAYISSHFEYITFVGTTAVGIEKIATE